MKTDLSHLPLSKQKQIKEIAQQVQAEIHNCEMIILYGSYARNDYVEYDERIEYSTLTSFMSDYDILVITAQEPSEVTGRKLDKIDSRYFNLYRTPIQFLVLSIHEMNKSLREGRFFHVQIKEEGILLYDSGNYTLVEEKPLDYVTIHKQAEEYFIEKFNKGDSFMRCGEHAFDDKDYPLASFCLHQACEFYFTSILLIHTLSNRKIHDLSKLLRVCSKYVPQLLTLFPQDTKKERAIFSRLKKSYKEARYNKDFNPTRENIIEDQNKINLLREIVQKACIDQINKYKILVHQQNSGLDTYLYPELDFSSQTAEPDENMYNDKDHYLPRDSKGNVNNKNSSEK